MSVHLTLTQPEHEDMRMDSTLNVTPEGSLNDLPAAVGGVGESRREPRTHHTFEEKLQDVCSSTSMMTLAEETPIHL